MCRIVISIGKTATGAKSNNDIEWTIKYDKEERKIENSLPMTDLSRI